MTVTYGKSSDRIEHCQECTLLADVDQRGRMPDHDVGLVLVGQCRGALRLSREELTRRAVKKAESLTDLAKAARPDAAVALDAYLSEKTVEAAPILARLDEFEALARHAYARRFKIRRKIRTIWRWEKHGNPALRPTPRSKVDVYCLFCGEMVLRGVALSLIGGGRPLWRRHLTVCMLLFLAGMRDAVPPGTKALPEEFRQDEP